MRLHRTKIGSTLYLHDSASTAKVMDNVVPNGPAAEKEDGTAEWIIDEAVTVPGASGSAAYTWDRSGNRVKYARYRCLRFVDGKVTKTLERYVYKSLD